MADPKKPPAGTPGGSPSPEDDRVLNPSADEFFRRLQSDMRRPQPSQEAISAALQAMQRLAAESVAADGAEGAELAKGLLASTPCDACGHRNRPGNQFCAMCGLPLEAKSGVSPAPSQSGAPGPVNLPSPDGPHHYHHHYHHHYFAQGLDQPLAAGLSRTSSTEAPREARLRASGPGQAMSRAETAVRKVNQDWAVACNSRQLDDLVSTYATDAMVLRPNHPAVRGSAAIREFFFSALEAGLGEVELEILRVDVVGDVAYEAGRCKMLVPVAVSKRREERGKYLTVMARQSNGEWRIVADCWSSDLNLMPSAESETTKANSPSISPQRSPVIPRKTT
jgi:ketosteroid isomerase-like protein